MSVSFKRVWLHISGQALPSNIPGKGLQEKDSKFTGKPSRKVNFRSCQWLLDIALVPISDHFLCNYRLTLHHVELKNFPHAVNWVRTFWSKLEIFGENWSNNGGWADNWYWALFHETMVSHNMSKTTPQDAHKRLVLQVYLGSNTLQFSIIRR